MDGTDRVAAALAEIRQRAEAATRGPWEADDDEDCWRLFGNAGFSGRHPLQLLKAPKHGTPYAEYVPGPADADFIVAARTDVPRLLAAVEAVLELAREWEAAEPSSKARLDATGAGITRSHGSDVRRVIAGKLLGGAPGHG